MKANLCEVWQIKLEEMTIRLRGERVIELRIQPQEGLTLTEGSEDVFWINDMSDICYDIKDDEWHILTIMEKEDGVCWDDIQPTLDFMIGRGQEVTMTIFQGGITKDLTKYEEIVSWVDAKRLACKEQGCKHCSAVGGENL